MNRFIGLISHANIDGAAVRIKPCVLAVNLLAAALLIPAFYPSIEAACGQSCRPAVVGYIVRDEKGNVLNEAQLESVRKEMTSRWDIRRMPFSEDGKTLIGEYSEEAKRAKILVPTLFVANASTCELGLEEVTLKYDGKTMRLRFKLWVYRRAIAVDSLPFEEGTFELEMDKEWPDRKESYKGESYILAKRWKKISDKP
jgi:hypothetical protein